MTLQYLAKEKRICNVRHQKYLKIPRVNTVYNGTETVLFWGTKTLKFIIMKIKELNSFNRLKRRIKQWKLEIYLSKLVNLLYSVMGSIFEGHYYLKLI